MVIHWNATESLHAAASVLKGMKYLTYVLKLSTPFSILLWPANSHFPFITPCQHWFSSNFSKWMGNIKERERERGNLSHVNKESIGVMVHKLQSQTVEANSLDFFPWTLPIHNGSSLTCWVADAAWRRLMQCVQITFKAERSKWDNNSTFSHFSSFSLHAVVALMML